MKEFLTAIGMIIIIVVLAVLYMGLDLMIASQYIINAIGG